MKPSSDGFTKQALKYAVGRECVPCNHGALGGAASAWSLPEPAETDPTFEHSMAFGNLCLITQHPRPIPSHDT